MAFAIQAGVCCNPPDCTFYWLTAHNYSSLLGGVSELLESTRRASARTVNAFMRATYWEVGVPSPTLRRHIGRHADPGGAEGGREAKDLREKRRTCERRI